MTVVGYARVCKREQNPKAQQAELHAAGATRVFVSTTPMGRALFGIVAVFAQLRVDTIRENTRLGLEYARAQGPLVGIGASRPRTAGEPPR